MRAAIVSALDGPRAVTVEEVPEPTVGEGQALVDVRAVGVSFPDLLLSKGEYQLRPDTPFALGVDFAGTLREDVGDLRAGQRVACCMPYGGAAETVAVPLDAIFPLPDQMSFEQGAAIPMNYLTAQFALAERAGLREGETVLVHGAAGGVGTATIQVARGMGARTIGVVSSEEKARLARAVGADDTVTVDGFRDAVRELTGGRGVDVVVDVVGGDLMTDSLRCLGTQGRLLVVGFTGGSIPQVKVNRLLLNNIDVRGVGWGAFAMGRPGYMRSQWDALLPMMESGVIDPPLGDPRPLEEMPQALQDMEDRRTLGKSVLTLA